MIGNHRRIDWHRIGQNRARFPPRGPKLQVHLLCRQPIGRKNTIFPILWVFAKIPADPVILTGFEALACRIRAHFVLVSRLLATSSWAFSTPQTLQSSATCTKA